MRRTFLLFALTSLFLNCKEVKKNEITTQKKELEKSIQIEEECLKDFTHFFKIFAKDSVFQSEHVKFPFKCYFHEDLMSNNFSIEIIKVNFFINILILRKTKKRWNLNMINLPLKKLKLKIK